MNEAFLHHLWKFRLYNKQQLSTTNGESIEVLRTGQHNTDSGPDFFNAQVKIGNTTWAGNVEIHLKSSAWNSHRHSLDESYNNVILHVVYEHDKEIFTRGNNRLPTLELKGRFNPGLYQNYESLVESQRWIPCANHIGKVDEITVSGWLERMLIERLETKTGSVAESLKQNKNNWEVTFYHLLAKNFGFKTNALPFEMLAKSLLLKALAKHKNHLLQLEAMLFGQAGMLDVDFADGYPKALKKEYEFLRKKFSLSPLQSSPWKFLRLRPSNFPTLRIAQFAGLIHRQGEIFSRILESETIADLQSLFSVTVSGYWETHYSFDQPSVQKRKSLGRDAIHVILVNTVIPFLFAFGKYHSDARYMDKALLFLTMLPPENNSIISKWAETGITSENAGRTQALLQLKNEYCNRKKCLFCGVGNKIIGLNL